jgi:hypothetical protein
VDDGSTGVAMDILFEKIFLTPTLCDNYKCTATTITNAQKPIKRANFPSANKVV